MICHVQVWRASKPWARTRDSTSDGISTPPEHARIVVGVEQDAMMRLGVKAIL